MGFSYRLTLNSDRLYFTINNALIAPQIYVEFDQTWHHVVGTYDGSMMRLYLD